MMSARSLLLHRYELLLCQSLPWCRRYVTAVSVAGRVYVIGGYDGHSRLKTVECLDLTVPKPDWCPITPMYRRRGLACSCVHNGKAMCGSVSWSPLLCALFHTECLLLLKTATLI